MTANQLFERILEKRSFLCVGLDTDIRKLPASLAASGVKDAMFEFNRAIVDATARYAVAFKPNLAFYEECGAAGWDSFARTCQYIRAQYPDMMIIADAKRGDIASTAQMYARAFFDTDYADAVTLSPYMGRDAVKPFLAYQGRWAVVLALTSNEGAADFQLKTLADGHKFYEIVLETASGWGTADNTMFVVGATQAAMLERVRSFVPEHFLLVPGVGAQGGSLEEVARSGMNKRCGLLVNASRSIIYASSGEDFAEAAGREAAKMQREMDALLTAYLPG